MKSFLLSSLFSLLFRDDSVKVSFWDFCSVLEGGGQKGSVHKLCNEFWWVIMKDKSDWRLMRISKGQILGIESNGKERFRKVNEKLMCFYWTSSGLTSMSWREYRSYLWKTFLVNSITKTFVLSDQNFDFSTFKLCQELVKSFWKEACRWNFLTFVNVQHNRKEADVEFDLTFLITCCECFDGAFEASWSFNFCYHFESYFWQTPITSRYLTYDPQNTSTTQKLTLKFLWGVIICIANYVQCNFAIYCFLIDRWIIMGNDNDNWVCVNDDKEINLLHNREIADKARERKRRTKWERFFRR